MGLQYNGTNFNRPEEYTDLRLICHREIVQKNEKYIMYHISNHFMEKSIPHIHGFVTLPKGIPQQTKQVMNVIIGLTDSF